MHRARADHPVGERQPVDRVRFATSPIVRSSDVALEPDNADSAAEGRFPPEFDPGLRELRWGDIVLKQFRQPADNQELILASFQELGWPPMIDDPLLRLDGSDEIAARDRLRFTVKNLNRYMKHVVVKFHVHRNGRAVTWSFCEEQ